MEKTDSGVKYMLDGVVNLAAKAINGEAYEVELENGNRYHGAVRSPNLPKEVEDWYRNEEWCEEKAKEEGAKIKQIMKGVNYPVVKDAWFTLGEKGFWELVFVLNRKIKQDKPARRVVKAAKAKGGAKGSKPSKKATRAAVFAAILREEGPLGKEQMVASFNTRYNGSKKETVFWVNNYLRILLEVGTLEQLEDGRYGLVK